MKDITENPILCKDCNRIMVKDKILKDGFNIRLWVCPSCNRKWYHPTDIQEYNNFTKISDKIFKVKLRMVGNSFCISIPREIIEFRELGNKLDQLVYLYLEEPEKITLSFSEEINRIRKLMEL